MMTVQPLNLRPLKVGEILDRAFRLYRANFLLFIGISGAVIVPLGALQVITQLFSLPSWVTQTVAYVQGLLTILMYGALIWAISKVYLGSPVSANDAYQKSYPRFWSLIGSNFLQGLAYIPLVVVLFVGGMGGAVGIICIFIVAIPYISVLSTRWSVAMTSIIIEDIGARESLKRSWSLTEKNAWHALGTLFIAGLLVYLLAQFPGIAFIFAAQQFQVLSRVGLAASTLLEQLGSLVSTPFSIGALVILYYDLRVRNEAYDLELAIQAGDNAPSLTE